MRSDYEAPKIDVVAIEKLETDTEALAFTVRLRITNPNPEPIRLEGLYYELNLEGLDVVNGTARDLPEIDGYSSETVSVPSAASLVNSIRLASLLMNASDDRLDYTLRSKLGTTSRWPPANTVEKTGQLSLSEL